LSRFTDGQRKVILGAGILNLAIAIFIFFITVAHGGEFPVTAPLLVISGVILVVLAKRG
jgi:hypothetical protein